MGELSRRIKEAKNYMDEKNISENAPFPKNMLLEVTNLCNDCCIFCANEKTTRKKRFVDKDFAMRILKEAYENGVREVGFYATGEPLLDKNLEKYIYYAKKIGFLYTYITTNGVMLDASRADSLLETGIDSIKFSINGFDRQDYFFIHGKDDFETVKENIKYLNRMRPKETKLYISCILTRQTAEKKEQFNEVFQEYCDEIFFVDCCNQGGYMHEIKEFLEPYENYQKIENYICPVPFNCLHISVEGYLTLCCADFQNYLAVADLNHETLSEAWINERARMLRKNMLNHNCFGILCENCMRNCEHDIVPLCKDLATIFDYNDWHFYREKTKQRIESYFACRISE